MAQDRKRRWSGTGVGDTMKITRREFPRERELIAGGNAAQLLKIT